MSVWTYGKLGDVSAKRSERIHATDRILDSAKYHYGLALAVFVGVSLLNVWLQRWLGYQALALVYLLAIVVLALFACRGAIMLGVTLTALGWNYLFAPPTYSFHIGSFYDRIMLVVYFVVALTVGQLTARLRAEREAGQEREERSTALCLFTQELAAATDRADFIARAVQQVSKFFGTEVALLLPPTHDKDSATLERFGSWKIAESDRRLALWAFEKNQPAGPENTLWPDAVGMHVPISTAGAAVGVLCVRWQAGTAMTAPQRYLLDSFAQQIALVLDRQRLRESEINSRLLVESERLGRTLLNSVSHELRTPIAAITGAASSLSGSGTLTRAQEDLLSEIETAATRLNQVVQSLLSAARLQSGQLRPAPDWCDISELIQVTLQHVGRLLTGHPIERLIVAGLPLIKADFVLTEQALSNLLVNAAVHTPAGTPIQIAARVEEKQLVLEVADRGPGLAPDQISRIFDHFHRAPNAKPGGTGLGLAITKGLIEAQGGSVRAVNRIGGGAAFRICLPVVEVPELQEEIG